MGSTKFVVVKAKELVKTAIFAVLGVIILVGLITFFLNMGKEEARGVYRDGTYYGSMKLGEETARVAVTIREGEIAKIALEDTAEAVAAFYPLLEPTAAEVGQEVVESQSLTVAVDAEAAHSAQLVLNAIAEGLEQAKR